MSPEGLPFISIMLCTRAVLTNLDIPWGNFHISETVKRSRGTPTNLPFIAHLKPFARKGFGIIRELLGL